MRAVRVRRPEVEETGLSPDEMLVALREGIRPVGKSDHIVVVVHGPRVRHVLHVRDTKRRQQDLHGVAL